MKKLSCLLTLSLCLTLTAACGSASSDQSAPTGDPGQSPTVAVSAPPAGEVTPYTGATFGLSRSAMAEAMSNTFSSSDLPNAFENDPDISELPDAENGDLVAYSYSICPGASCILYEAKDSGELTQVFLTGDSSQLSESDAKVFGSYLAVVTGGFSSSKEIASLDESLDIANAAFTDGTMNFFNGESASFSYIVTGGLAMLTVLPPL